MLEAYRRAAELNRDNIMGIGVGFQINNKPLHQ
jgi:hypothetical protein